MASEEPVTCAPEVKFSCEPPRDQDGSGVVSLNRRSNRSLRTGEARSGPQREHS